MNMMNDNTDLPILTTNIDKSQVPPIDQKRMIAFINHFITNTVTSLNEFMTNIESKFIEFDSKLQKVESSLIIVEAKMASVPDVFEQPKVSAIEKEDDFESKAIPENPPELSKTIDDTKTNSGTDANNKTILIRDITDDGCSVNDTCASGVKACDDVRYRKYFKMMQFGVPAAAVKLKMQAEGFAGELLDDPNRILDDGIASNAQENES